MATAPEFQQIRFVSGQDGVRICYATHGKGPPLVKAANWLSHVDLDWNSPVWRHWLRDLSAEHTLVRYDERGCGLSEREVADLSFESWVRDLECVVDAIGLRRFPLLGVSQGGAVAIAYAARHPERVSQLILYGAYGQGRLVRDPSPAMRDEAETMRKLIELGWGRESDAFRQVFTAQFIPGGTLEQLQWFNALQRDSTSAANAARFLDEFNSIDVMDFARQVQCPTLVLHAKGDERVPFSQGVALATQIPGARFVALESRNHVLLEEPAWRQFLDALREFLGTPSSLPTTRPLSLEEPLTAREQQLLHLLACGMENAAIAERMGLQSKTVRNYVSNILDKMGVRTRAQAIIVARDAGFGLTSN